LHGEALTAEANCGILPVASVQRTKIYGVDEHQGNNATLPAVA